MKYVAGIIAVIMLALGVMHLTSKNEDTAGVRQDGLAVATSFYPLQFALERIVGDLGTVTNIGAGTDPHDFKPTTQDMLALQKADLVVLQGADFEPWGDDVVHRLEEDGVPVVIATADIKLHEGGHHHDEHEEDVHHDEHMEDHEHEEDGHGHEHEDEHMHGEGEYHGDHADEHEEDGHDEHNHGAYDPHTWLDPVLFKDMVAHMTEAIVTIDADNTATYEANAAALTAELDAIHTAYESTLATCALNEVIISHDAFGYLAERYGFEVHAIAGLSTKDTPSAITMAALKEEAEEGIGAILLEENSIAAYGETLARETGLQTLSINPIAYLVPEGENYGTLMEQNLDTFATALNCNE